MRVTVRVFAIAIASVVLCTSVAANGRVETVRFHSKLVNATLPYNVILPTDYATARSTRYPVLYLLHGLTGHYSDWLTRTNVADYASRYRLIVVMPEGNNGWYTDSATVTTDKYESYILQELLPDVQQRYRTIEARYGRDSPLIFQYNRELAALMLEKKIPYEYRELPGNHSWVYWARQVQEILRIAGQKLGARGISPATFEKGTTGKQRARCPRSQVARGV